MKRLLSIFIVALFVAPSIALGAVSVKKAASVKTQETKPADSATSLLPSVIGVVGNVKNLNAQQQQLTADCVATSDEIRIVNDLVKEWAKIGETDAESAATGLGQLCTPNGDVDVYTRSEEGLFDSFMNTYAENNEKCYERFTGPSNKEMVWFKFPRVSSAKVCDVNNPKNCKSVSNLYDVFAKIPFDTEDLTKSEAAKVAKLIEKSQKCAKLNAAKRELFGNFLTQTLSGVGKSSGVSGTESVIQAVSSAGGGGIQSMLPSLGSVATQLLDK